MTLKRMLAALLAVVLLPVPALGQAEETGVLWSQTTALTDTVSLTERIFLEEERQSEHYITYTPGGQVLPMVASGSVLTEKLSFDQAAAMAEADGKRVVAGVNGDYYVVATNLPLGIVIEDGRLLASDAGNWALGFQSDGSAFLGKPALKMQLTIDGEKYRLGGINKSIKKGDYYLYTPEFGSKTGSGVNTRNVVLTMAPGQRLQVGETLTLTVESNYKSPDAVEIPEDRLLLCLTADSDQWRQQGLDKLEKGAQLTLEISAQDPRWETCSYAMGSLYKLVSGGAEEPGLDEIDDKYAPRTAVGIRADGTVIFYTVDGRQSGYSKGLTLSQVAKRLLALDCVEAGVLDGGGSTTLRGQQAGEDDCALINRPSLGKEREVSTYLLLAASGSGSGQAKTLSVRAQSPILLAGSATQLTAGACDETGAPVPLRDLRWQTGDGAVSRDGVFQSPDYACSALVNAYGGGSSGQIAIRVVETPDELRILNQETGRVVTAMTLNLGERVDLSAQALWHSLEVYAEDAQFHWSYEGEGGSIDSFGCFTAAGVGGAGAITVRAGERSITIAVTVKSAVMCIADFETAISGGAEGLAWSQETGMDRVRCGYGSLRLDYDLEQGSAAYPLDLPWAEVSHYATLWVYGDGSGNKLYSVHNGIEAYLDTLDFVGWKLVTVDTSVYGGIRALRLDGSGSGTLWLDQILLTDYLTPDLEPPIVQLSADGPLLSGYVTDRMDGCLKAAQIELTLDGVALPFAYDEVTGALTALVEDNGLLRRATLTARDQSGNINTVSVSLAGESGHSFPDMEGHWAAEYAGYLSRMGVVNGRADPDGVLCFDPDSPVTRAEFAVMLCRWLRIDTGLYAQDSVFADGAHIPAWARESIYAAAALGFIQGEMTDQGLLFHPQDKVTRAQAATMLGRTLEGGRMGADLAFSDAQSIPAWARQYVSLLAFMGVMRGYDDGNFDPAGSLTRAQAAKLLTLLS